jgi:hypothetical protein
MHNKELGCEEARWMALAKDRVVRVISDIGSWGYTVGRMVHYEDGFHGNKLVGTGSGSCSVASFDTSGVGNSCYATAELVNEKGDTGFEILATVKMRIQFFWYMKSRRWVIGSDVSRPLHFLDTPGTDHLVTRRYIPERRNYAKLGLTKIGFQMAQNFVQWRNLMLEVHNTRVLLSESCLISKT